MSRAAWPTRYEIRVASDLEDRWSEWFEGLEIEREAGETVLVGTVVDQSALHGILDKLCDLGLAVISVRRLPFEDEEETR